MWCSGQRHALFRHLHLLSSDSFSSTLLSSNLSLLLFFLRSENVQNTTGPDHFWKLRCRKSARRCGAKHISKSKCAKHLSVGRLLEVEMSKKCTPLWCEAHLGGHNGVQLFISPLARWLRTRRFSEPTFRPPGATNHWKNTVNRDFPTFSLLLFSLLIFLFSLPLPCSAFHPSILSEV